MKTFSERVWELATSIPPGRVTTYGTLAKRAGGTGQSARSVSAILNKAPNQKSIPWHRIVYADGRVWLPPAQTAKRVALYRREGIVLEKNKIKDFSELLYDFSDL